MTITHLFAGVPTADFDAALEWYESFLGRAPDRYPHAREAVWQLADTGLLYLVADPNRAGNALTTLIVDDLDRWIREVGSRGIACGEVDTVSGAVRKTTVLDPDGNMLTVGQPLGSGRQSEGAT